MSKYVTAVAVEQSDADYLGLILRHESALSKVTVTFSTFQSPAQILNELRTSNVYGQIETVTVRECKVTRYARKSSSDYKVTDNG